MQFPRNAVILKDEDEVAALYLIVSGKIKQNELIDDECETITDIKEAGQYFGEQALLGDSSQKYSVTVIEDSVLAVLNKHENAQFGVMAKIIACPLITYSECKKF